MVMNQSVRLIRTTSVLQAEQYATRAIVGKTVACAITGVLASHVGPAVPAPARVEPTPATSSQAVQTDFTHDCELEQQDTAMLLAQAVEREQATAAK